MERTAERLRRQIVSARGSAPDWRTFASRCAQSVARGVGADGWCVATADPATFLMTGVVADHGEPAPRFFEMEYGVPDYVEQITLARGPERAGSLHAATDGRLHASPRWRELIEPWGFDDQLRAALVSRRGCWGYLALLRERGSPPFTPEDSAAVAAIGGALADGIRFTFLAEVARARSDAGAPGIVLLDERFVVVDATAAVANVLGDVLVGERSPAAVAAVAARSRSTHGMAMSHIRVGGTWITMHASPLAGESRGAVTAVVVDVARPHDLLELFATAAGLTAREADVARAVVRGCSTKEIAQSLLISPFTVQQHLKAIFDKLGVRSRRELVGLVFERQYLPELLGTPRS